VRSRNAPRMTIGSAALIELMHRYLSGLMDPFVSLLEVHKLMYFMQEAAQPLRLSYAAGPYGPYAENLKNVFALSEGHMTIGYGDGGDSPDKVIELLPGVVERASGFLATDTAARERFERVSNLVDGFETSSGMELL